MDKTETPRGAALFDGELEVGYDESFEKGWRRTELTSHALMLVIVGVAASGLLGRGPVSHRIDTSVDGRISVEFEPIARHGVATQITLRMAVDQKSRWQPGTIELHVDSSLLQPMGLQRILPVPTRSYAGGSGVTYVFDVDSTEPSALIRFEVKPSSVGQVTVHAGRGDSTVAWTQWVVP